MNQKLVVVAAAAAIVAGCAGGSGSRSYFESEEELAQESCGALENKFASMSRREMKLAEAADMEMAEQEMSAGERFRRMWRRLIRSGEAAASEMAVLQDDIKTVKRIMRDNGCEFDQ